MSRPKAVAVIGAGLAGIAAASYLAKPGYQVHVFEKNNGPGGRVRQFQSQGFTFDMGPSWYWMPDILEQYFRDLGRSRGDYYSLEPLDPAYRVYFSRGEVLELPRDWGQLLTTFESIEPGAGAALDAYLEDASRKYRLAMGKFVQKPSLTAREYLRFDLLKAFWELNLLTPISRHIRRFFHDPRLIQILEFPTLLLGATPTKTPALYSLMNYADMVLGTWYPQGGIGKVSESMYALSLELGVTYSFDAEVDQINVDRGCVAGLTINGERIPADVIIANGDYHHIETHLLDTQHRSYTEAYWESRILSPSSLIFYVGVGKSLLSLGHHNLFFDTEFDPHATAIYDEPRWPEEPQFYVSCTSKSDVAVAPPGAETLFILIPVAPDLEDSKETRKRYYEQVLDRLERITGEAIREYVVFNRSYAHTEFKRDYHAYKGNAYGLASTLRQTAFLRPKVKSRRVRNLYYTGQLTVPGPGMPPALISGKIAAELVEKEVKDE
ncbi:MAG: phytoene desaturase [Fidelibacterota bacterium]|nr:MAG: phytoene desaturase [Candidatus Neomarinimicrobiota bacterium]